MGLPFATHTDKIETKRTIKSTNPENNIEKTNKKK
jgi:hypothetical protein